MMHYTGIGARRTPIHTLMTMTNLATNLELSGFILRSGGADGADSAFELGVKDPDHKEIYLPWQGFNNNTSDKYYISKEAYAMAKYYHPAWARCSSAARKFHARNCYQVLGRNLNLPSQFILCWTPNAEVTGGTGQAMRIALDHDITIHNMADEHWESAFNEHVTDILVGP